MTWRIPVGAVLALFVVTSCEQTPTATEDAAPEAPRILLNADGNNGAVRWIPDDECGVIDGYGYIVWTPCTNQIATYSSNGNAIVVVKGSGVDTPGGVVRWGPDDPGPDFVAILDLYFGIDSPPYPCVVLGPAGELLFTVNWYGHVTPSGEATFVCHYAEQWEYQWPD